VSGSPMKKGHGSPRGRLGASLVASVAVALALPAAAAAFEPLAVIGGSGVGKLRIPLGVAVDGVSGVYVAEHVNQRVSQFTTAGAFVRAWGFNVRPGGGKGFEVCTKATGCKPGLPGGRAGQLGFPGGIAADASGHVYVTDPANDRVSEFTTEGAFVHAFGFGVVPGGGKGLEVCTKATGCKRGIAGGRAGQLDRPAYVATDATGGVYVTDEANNRVNQFTTEGAFVRAWGFDVTPGAGAGFEVCTGATGCKRGESGGRAGQLSFPDGVAADGAGNLYVADANSRLSQFTTEGAFVRAVGFDVVPGGGKGFEECTAATGCKRGIAGGGAGQLSFTLGVETGATGNVYVADSDNGRVSEFAGGGAFVGAFGLDVISGGGRRFEVCTAATGCKRGRSGAGAGGFLFPSAVAADPSGAIYVADAGGGRIQCFGGPTGTPCVRNLFGFGAIKLDRRRGTATLAVEVPGPGNLRVRGKQIKSVGMHPGAAGTVSLAIRPRSKARRRLNREGAARVRVGVTYMPTDGGPNTRFKRIKLRKRR
jgi:DNA-binding beta-propeller fold protein YncE